MKSSGPSAKPTSRDGEGEPGKGKPSDESEANERPGAGKFDKGRLLDELEVMHKLGHLRPVGGAKDREDEQDR